RRLKTEFEDFTSRLVPLPRQLVGSDARQREVVSIGNVLDEQRYGPGVATGRQSLTQLHQPRPAAAGEFNFGGADCLGRFLAYRETVIFAEGARKPARADDPDLDRNGQLPEKVCGSRPHLIDEFCPTGAIARIFFWRQRREDTQLGNRAL